MVQPGRHKERSSRKYGPSSLRGRTILTIANRTIAERAHLNDRSSTLSSLGTHCLQSLATARVVAPGAFDLCREIAPDRLFFLET